ncbi:MAG: cell division protein FtsZ [Bacteroidales bacterium]
MIEFEMPKNEGSIIKVIGVGGAGGNAVKHMLANGVNNVDFIICNTDYQDLVNSPIERKIQLGPKLTEGLGAGSKPDIGRQAALETTAEIEEAVKNAEMVFVTAGMGGGTGTGAAPIVAKVCKDLGILTVGIVTIPFKNEGLRRLRHACRGLEELVPNVDSLLIVNNERIIDIFGDLTISESFAKADDVLTTAAKGIAEIINATGYINVLLSNVESIMRNSGLALMGSGRASGVNRAIEALENALHSPLLNNNNVFGAKNVLISIYSSTDHEITPGEINTIYETMQNFSGNNADVIPGSAIDDTLGEEVSVTVIATGFDKLGLEQYLNNDYEGYDLLQMQEKIYKPSTATYSSSPITPMEDKYKKSHATSEKEVQLSEDAEIYTPDLDVYADFYSMEKEVIAELGKVPAYLRRGRKNMKRRDSNAHNVLSDKGVVQDNNEKQAIITQNRYLNRNED